jgi:hypothetical protein
VDSVHAQFEDFIGSLLPGCVDLEIDVFNLEMYAKRWRFAFATSVEVLLAVLHCQFALFDCRNVVKVHDCLEEHFLEADYFQ